VSVWSLEAEDMVEYSNEVQRSNHDSIIRWKKDSLEKRNNKNNDTHQ